MHELCELWNAFNILQGRAVKWNEGKKHTNKQKQIQRRETELKKTQINKNLTLMKKSMWAQCSDFMNWWFRLKNDCMCFPQLPGESGRLCDWLLFSWWKNIPPSQDFLQIYQKKKSSHSFFTIHFILRSEPLNLMSIKDLEPVQVLWLSLHKEFLPSRKQFLEGKNP